jgi:hypothetical protein
MSSFELASQSRSWVKGRKALPSTLTSCRHVGLVTAIEMAISGVGVEKLGTSQPILMSSVWQYELFSSIV